MPSRLFAAAVAALSLAVPATAEAAKARPAYYVSLGDSYAAGYQRFSEGVAKTTRDGFAYQVVPKARARGHNLKLVNFGCGGGTNGSILGGKAKRGGGGPGDGEGQGQRQGAAQAPAQGGRAESAHRRHHLSRRDPGLLGRREPESGPGRPVRHRVQGSPEPRAQGHV